MQGVWSCRILPRLRALHLVFRWCFPPSPSAAGHFSLIPSQFPASCHRAWPALSLPLMLPWPSSPAFYYAELHRSLHPTPGLTPTISWPHQGILLNKTFTFPKELLGQPEVKIIMTYTHISHIFFLLLAVVFSPRCLGFSNFQLFIKRSRLLTLITQQLFPPGINSHFCLGPQVWWRNHLVYFMSVS